MPRVAFYAGDRVQVLQEDGTWRRGEVASAARHEPTSTVTMVAVHLVAEDTNAIDVSASVLVSMVRVWKHKRRKPVSGVRKRSKKPPQSLCKSQPRPPCISSGVKAHAVSPPVPPQSYGVCGLWGCTLSRLHPGMCVVTECAPRRRARPQMAMMSARPASPGENRCDRPGSEAGSFGDLEMSTAPAAVTGSLPSSVEAGSADVRAVCTAPLTAIASPPAPESLVDTPPPHAPTCSDADVVMMMDESAGGGESTSSPPTTTPILPAPPVPPIDPLEQLRKVAASKGLVLERFTGRNLPEGLASDALELAKSNMSAITSWDAPRRAADLQHSQTKILVLRRPHSVARLAEGTQVPARRASRSSSAAVTPSPPQGAPDVLVPSEVQGFASFRHVTQETLPVVYLFELHLEASLRRQGLGTLLMEAVRAHGREARRSGLLLTVHLTNTTARSFYAARGLAVAPISPSRCAPPHVASAVDYDVMQDLWEPSAVAIMEERGRMAHRVLHGGSAQPEPDSAPTGDRAPASPPKTSYQAARHTAIGSEPISTTESHPPTVGASTTAAVAAHVAVTTRNPSGDGALSPVAWGERALASASMRLADLCIPPRRAAVAAGARIASR